jgi:hypothetical protein
MQNETLAFILTGVIAAIVLILIYTYFTVSIKAVACDIYPDYNIRVGFTVYTLKNSAVYRLDNIFVFDCLTKAGTHVTLELLKFINKDFNKLERDEIRTKIYLRKVFNSN